MNNPTPRFFCSMLVATIVLLIHTGCSFSLEAQKVLMFDIINGNHFKRIRYYEGDLIALRVKNDNITYKGELNEISDTAFFVNDNFVMLDSVDAIIRYNNFVKGVSYSAFGAAAITGIISILDYALVVRGGPVDAYRRGYFVAPVMAGIGFALIPFWKRTRKIGENRLLKIIDLSPK